MDAIQVKNFRCLEDTGLLSLRPLNVIVGANSSGKSSFLRIFPLFKQGINSRKRGPILWYGPEVDFGDFKTTVRRGQDLISIKIIFSENIVPIYLSRNLKMGRIEVEFDIKNTSKYDYVSRMYVRFAQNQEVEIKFLPAFKKADVYVNNKSYASDLNIFYIWNDRLGVFPRIAASLPLSGNERESPVMKIISEMQRLLSQVSGDKPESDVFDLRFWLSEAVVDIKENITKTFVTKFEVPQNVVEENGVLFETLNDLMVLSHIEDIVDYVNFLVTRDFETVNYIKPIRASAERYYRMQNLSVNELDSDGRNVPIFLNELLNTKQRDLFNNWTKKAFGFEVKTREKNGQVSVLIKDKNNVKFDNISDKGFGYSQLLPIIIMLWNWTFRMTETRLKTERLNTKIIAIEQPELHLHPNMQVMFIDALISAIVEAKKLNIPIKFIIETHSQVMINRIGLHIAKHNIESERVSILLFDEMPIGGKNVRVASYNEEGFLKDWPIGFFTPKEL